MPLHTPLPVGGVRLLRLLPHPHEDAHIECQLITCTLLGSGRTHPFEALSYVWGPVGGQQSINLDGHKLPVGANLHAALSHLRDRFVERILWVDAICIKQDDNDEKVQQVRAMAKIYSKASRVIVWLGEATSNSSHALEIMRRAAEEQRASAPTDETNRQAILRLLEREWFQRIWVLQEVAAARHIVIKCGSTEIDGYAFCSGLDVLKPFGNTRQELQALISPVSYLIKGAVFRRRYEGAENDTKPGGFSLNIRALGELVDMYHTRKATVLLDKVYALLGMSSDDPYAAGLSPNYTVAWSEVFRNLVGFCLSDQISASTYSDEAVAVIEGKGHVIGGVSSVGADPTRDDRQHVEITWASGQLEEKVGFTFPVTAKAIMKGDIVCLLQGKSMPTIVRLRDGFSTIIMAAIPATVELPETWSKPVATLPIDLLLIWDWDEHQRKPADGDHYANFINSRGAPKCPMPQCQCLDHLDKATRLWNFGLLQNRLRRYPQAVQNIRKAVNLYGKGAALRNAVGTHHGHGPWREVDESATRMLDYLLVDDKGVEIQARFEENDQTPLHWAVEENHEAVVRLLAQTGADLEEPDEFHRTPLTLAAANGQEAVVRVLVMNGAEVEAKHDGGVTPLALAADQGHEAVVRVLLATGKVDVEGVSRWRGTPLSRAAANGHEAVVKLLLEEGKADADSTVDEYWKPLACAAVAGHEAVVKLLLATGKVDVNRKADLHGQTPLSLAAEYGHEAIVKLLLATGKADVDSKDNRFSQTPLSLAAAKGHKAIVELLIATGKVDVDSKASNNRTPLSWAAANGHEAVIRALLPTGKVDTSSKDSEYGRTPLSWAAANGHGSVVRLLTAMGKADADTKDCARL